MYTEINIPPGVFANGTDLQASGRWRDASLVRWRNGSMMPVGGWRERFASLTGDTPTGTPRGMAAWVDNGYDRHIAFGTYNGLYEVNVSGVIDDITPTGLQAGNEKAAVSVGYGTDVYGLSTFGTPRADTGVYSDATVWTLDTWGENLVACSDADGKLYEWDLISARASQIANSPTSCASLVSSDERFLFALGADGEPNLVAWCDREDNTTWAPVSSNEAGSLTLKTDGRLMCGVRVRGQVVFLTDVDVWVANYIGPPFVYGFERVGTHCGVASKKAAVAYPHGAIWLGVNGFYRYAGGVVEPVACDVLDEFLSGVSTTYISQVHAVQNSQFNEVWWFYVSESATECDRYVAYNYAEGHWSTGALDRTTGVDRGVFNYPIWMGPARDIYDHEVGTVPATDAVYAESGPIVIDNNVATAIEMLPDEETQGEVTAAIKARIHPNGTETSTGLLSMTNPTPFRITGRQFRLRVEGVPNKDWRVGIQRLFVKGRGRR